MSPKISDRRLTEAKIASWIRKNSKKKQEFFFTTRELFEGIDMNYDDKNDYRIIMDIIHQWRRQAPFFYDTMVQEGDLTGQSIYVDFEQFLKDLNDIGCYFLWNKNIKSKEGNVIYGFYQPMTVDAKIKIDSRRNGKAIKQLKNRMAEMIQMGRQPLPSGHTPELALAAIERYEQKYLLPEHKD